MKILATVLPLLASFNPLTSDYNLAVFCYHFINVTTFCKSFDLGFVLLVLATALLFLFCLHISVFLILLQPVFSSLHSVKILN